MAKFVQFFLEHSVHVYHVDPTPSGLTTTTTTTTIRLLLIMLLIIIIIIIIIKCGPQQAGYETVQVWRTWVVWAASANTAKRCPGNKDWSVGCAPLTAEAVMEWLISRRISTKRLTWGGDDVQRQQQQPAASLATTPACLAGWLAWCLRPAAVMVDVFYVNFNRRLRAASVCLSVQARVFQQTAAATATSEDIGTGGRRSLFDEMDPFSSPSFSEVPPSACSTFTEDPAAASTDDRQHPVTVADDGTAADGTWTPSSLFDAAATTTTAVTADSQVDMWAWNIWNEIF